MSLIPQIRTDENGDFFFFSPEDLASSPSSQHPAEEGELSVDVHETSAELIVQSTIAGVALSDLEISLHNDLLTIRGARKQSLPPGAKPLFSECYWGPFSRSLILPAEIRADEASAVLRAGVLTVTLPKRHRSSIPVREIE